MNHRRTGIIAFGLLIAAWIAYLLFQTDRAKRQGKFDSIIAMAAKEFQLDPALIKAVIWKESRFDPNAKGTSGEIGLMQLMDAAAYEWVDSALIDGFVPEHLYDPHTNTLAGCYYLAKMIKFYPECDDPIPYALASYNAGRGRVLKWSKGAARTNSVQFIEAIGFASTKQYVKEILSKRREYQPDKP